MNEPADEQPDPRTIARTPSHQSGGEQDRQGPFDLDTFGWGIEGGGIDVVVPGNRPASCPSSDLNPFRPFQPEEPARRAGESAHTETGSSST